MSRNFDVIVLGLGGMGSAAACSLAQRGQRVLGLERFQPAHAHGSSHGRSRVFRTAYFEDPAYVPLLLRAHELWRERTRPDDTPQPLFVPTGGLMLGRADGALVSGSLRSARLHGLPHELLDAAALRARHPAFRAPPGTVALLDPLAGYVDPELSVRTHLRLAQDAGATLHFGETARGFTAAASGDRVRVDTDRGSYEAGQLVVTAGPWAPALLADLGLPLHVERHVLYWFAPPAGTAAFLPPAFPVYIWETAAGEEFYGFPHQPGPPGGVKVAMFHEAAGSERCTPDTIDRTVHPPEVERMRRCLAGHIPGLAGPLVTAATCMYTRTPDGHFILDRHPRHPNVVLASPCSGHGFKFVPAIGEILADLAAPPSTGTGTAATPARDLSLFALARFAAPARPPSP